METPQQMPIDMNIPYAPRRVPSELSLSGTRLLGVTRDELHPNSLTTVFEEMIHPTARDLEWEFAATGYSSTTPPPTINTKLPFDIDTYFLRDGELPISGGYPAPPPKYEEIVKCDCKNVYLIVNKETGKTRMGHKKCGWCDCNVIPKE